MYPAHHAAMAPPQKPETFMLSNEAQQSLPQDAQIALQQVDNLKYFLISAPVDWSPDQCIRRFLLPTGEYVSCVLWNNLFHISGTDIVRCLSFRFQAFGRPVRNTKKFEEGIFSDLRNLKAGTDASLEEPKSPFLDFLYKNNCIRTQKKQKVFYWYSVPHDRLFLDALERDLKREKMGQDATTIAVNEPALSFQFDSSQSLFEQLTKAQQANTSSFAASAAPAVTIAAAAATATAYSQQTPPDMRATTEPMAPPQMPPTNMSLPQDENHMMSYGQMSVNNMSGYVKAEQDFGQFTYDRNGVPISRIHQRHASMPAFVDYSPAPSFVSSHYDEYSNRGISYEPITPPQHTLPLAAEPAYIPNEDTGLYSVIPDLAAVSAYGPIMSIPASNLSGPQFSAAARAFPGTSVYSGLEGSPTYKQRRRRSSIPPTVPTAVAGNPVNGQAHSVHRSSDLRRSISTSVQPLAEDEPLRMSPAVAIAAAAYPSMIGQHKELLDLSRQGTPLSLDGSPSLNPLAVMNAQDDFANITNGDLSETSVHTSPITRPDRTGPVRRARSATMMEMGPYPHKSHSCPIPTCGRLFKRLEHLKRHVRTHTNERPYICPHCNKTFSRSDNLAQHRRTHDQQTNGEIAHYTSEEELENEENEFGSLNAESPDQAYLSTIPTTMPSSMPTSTPTIAVSIAATLPSPTPVVTAIPNINTTMNSGLSVMSAMPVSSVGYTNTSIMAPTQLMTAQILQQPM